MTHRYIVPALLTLSFLTLSCRAADPDPDIVDAEKTLKAAGLGTDDDALLRFFRERIVADADRNKIATAIKQLGDDSFEVREKAEAFLIKAGRAALAPLQKAQESRDPEVVSRAKKCLELLDAGTEWQRAMAAARLLAQRNTKGASSTLLDYLPFADDELVQESIFAALAKLDVKGGKADDLIREAVESKVMVRRLAAAYVLCRAAEDDRKLAVKLLQDTDVPVRFQAASGLLRAGVKDAVPELARLLTDAPPPFAYQAEDLLFRIAGDKPPTASLGKADDAARKQSREAWETWWKANSEKVDLAKISVDNALKGLTLIVNYAKGPIWACDKDGKMNWKIDCELDGPVDVRLLPNGNVLVAEHNASRVTERDRDGKIVWTQQTNGNSTSCQRLPNGNTLIATMTEISEVTRDNKVVFKLAATGGSFWCAYKGKDGKILAAQSNGEVVELDAAGKQLRSVKVGGMQAWGGAEMLPNGNVLVAQFSQNQVVEVDWSGKVVWQANATSCTYAQLLPSGNVLVTSLGGQCTIELDRNGKEVWKQATQGQSFRTWRY